MIGILKKLLFTKPKHAGTDPDVLRNTFRSRYHHFKLLLNANNGALEVMAEIEDALRGTRPFGMSYVLSRCTNVSTRVWQIVQNLNELAPGQEYEELYERFKEIQQRINPFVQRKTRLKEGPLVIPMADVDKDTADLVGEKMANLGEIRNRVHSNVPDGFVITAKGYQRFMEQSDLQAEIDRKIQATNIERLDQLYRLSARIQQAIIAAPLPGELESAIKENFRLLQGRGGGRIRVAMRSSALGEDLRATSFAGQYRSELNVSGDNLLQTYKEIVASKYGLTAMSYRYNRGIRDEDVDMCVGCMIMADAVSSGVMYSSNPVDIRDERVIINAVWGLPKPVVDGSAATDLFIISRGEPAVITQKDIPFKEQKFTCYPEEGVCRLEPIAEEALSPSLSDEKAMELARLAVKLEAYYGTPRDIEWAVHADGSIVVLQCRPLLQKATHELPDLKRATDQETGAIILQGGFKASPGVAAGPVYVVNRDMDAMQFPEGAVLVTVQSLPRWATLLSRAAAVITEKGSIAGHFASVAREFEVPALIGVQGALDHLKKDQMVTVDADGLRVYDGRIERLLGARKDPKNLMVESPVFRALKGAAQHIVPLRLLDPDAPSFKAKHCQTFHDITRFCHEKAVHEMFRFGRDHHFSEHSSKQLLCDVPMQWWVLNLDDGFKEEVTGPHVRLENIVSVPMLAVWRGITRFPWEGPPAVDGKGFMSIMFEATRNPALVPGLRTRYADRNYFMVSKNFCSLNSRLGFHFSIVEALVSERPSENYVRFQFKGGAADDQRRQSRILFIKDLLEGYGFRAEVRNDHLLAGIEDHEQDFMEARLEILGYLTIHVRQLDMIMSNDARVNHYKEKFNNDIRTMIASD